MGEFHFDAWELFILIGYGMLFGRHIALWWASEREGRPSIPTGFWWLSIVGGIMLVIYSFVRGLTGQLLPAIIALGLYLRNLQLDFGWRRYLAWRRAQGMDDLDYPWPTVSLIVPVHNEGAGMVPTLESLMRQYYPGPRPEIIVALNGCTDNSREIAGRFDVTIVESDQAGMSFGKNLGGRAANGDILFFIDADSTIGPDTVRMTVEQMIGHDKAIATMPARPDRGGGVVRGAFWFSNRYCRRRQVQSAGGTLAVTRASYKAVAGFDETIPQGTSSDFFMRVMADGATFIWAERARSTTSIRRFEKKGVVQQMLEWRRNHDDLAAGRKDAVQTREYDVIR